MSALMLHLEEIRIPILTPKESCHSIGFVFVENTV